VARAAARRDRLAAEREVRKRGVASEDLRRDVVEGASISGGVRESSADLAEEGPEPLGVDAVDVGVVGTSEPCNVGLYGQ
jgi:hypothetical protein